MRFTAQYQWLDEVLQLVGNQDGSKQKQREGYLSSICSPYLLIGEVGLGATSIPLVPLQKKISTRIGGAAGINAAETPCHVRLASRQTGLESAA